MKHATTCLPNVGDIAVPDRHTDTFNTGAYLAPDVSPLTGSAALTANAAEVCAAAAKLGIDAARFERYAVRRWGRGWQVHADGRRQALDEMERYRNDPKGFLDKVDTYLRLEGRLL